MTIYSLVDVCLPVLSYSTVVAMDLRNFLVVFMPPA